MKLLSMSGFIPEQICDTVRFSGYAGERNISHFCGYANDFISQVINDDTIDGAIFPKSCDSTRVINSYIQDANKFSFQINVPARNDELSVVFFAKQIEKLKNSIEQYFDISIDNIPERIERINNRNEKIGNYYNEIENYSYADYLRKIHIMMQNPLMDEYDFSIKKTNNNGKRVFLVGPFLSNTNIAEKIENNGYCVVGDNLPESGRLADSVIEEIGEDIYLAIAKNILSRKLSPTQNNFRYLINEDLDCIKAKSAEAVIFITQQYCEPYDYLYSVYKKELVAKGIPSLKLTLNDSQDDRKVDLMLEAFRATI